MSEIEAAEAPPIAVPADQVLRVAESGLALVCATLAGSGGGALVERMIGLWRDGKLDELVGVLNSLRDNLPPQPERMN